MTQTTTKAWLTPADIIEEYGIKRTKLYGFLSSGDLPSAKVGRNRHVKREDLEDFLDKRRRT